jgi:UDP-2-acetamido-2-deoxy-ribo-hexuluronate aminotransferase
MDLLLDVNIIVDICAPREQFEKQARDAITLCRQSGGRLWVYTGSVQTLEYTLFHELKRMYDQEDQYPTNRQIMCRANDLLKEFCRDKNWLAALSGEGPVFEADDPEDEQLILALQRFPEGSAKLLTRDGALLRKHPYKMVTPESYLSQGVSSGKPLDFIDLKIQQDAIRPALERRIHGVLHHGQYIMGPEIKELENQLSAYVGVKHCVTCASGTDGLLMALMALDIGPGDEVITVPYTWISTAEVIALLRAKPVFVDIQPDTFNIDPEKLESAITPRTKAIMPVGIYGQCADMTRIGAIAQKHNIPVIEDAAQCFGATINGKKACSLSLIGCTSFFPSKPLGCYGDGGAIFTPDDGLADKLRQIRVHGQKVKHQHPLVGINGRLDTLQAAILLEKFTLFPEEITLRQQVARRYDSLLSASNLKPQTLPSGFTSVYAQYTILAPNRDALSKSLQEKGIPSVAYYTRPLHLQGAFADLGYKEGDFPVSERVAAHCLSLPMSPYLTQEDQKAVAAAMR